MLNLNIYSEIYVWFLKKNANLIQSEIDLNDGYGIQLSVNSIKLLNNIGFKKKFQVITRIEDRLIFCTFY